MVRQLCSVLLVLLICCSCSKKQPPQNNVVNFPDPVQLKGQQIVTDIYQLASIRQFDSLLVVTANMDEFFHVFNKDGTHIASFGREGRGPGEFLRVPFLTDIYRENSQIHGLIDTEISNEAVTVNLSASVSEDEVVVHDNPPLPPDINRASLMQYFNMQESVYAGMLANSLFNQFNNQMSGFYYNSNEDTLTILPLHNLEIEPYEKFPAVNLNNRTAKVSPDRSKLAFGMMYYPMVEVFKNGSEKPVQYLLEPNPTEGPFQLSDVKEDKIEKYSTNIFATDQYIYLLGARKNGNPDQDQHIFVMDWEGNGEAKYKIPGKYDLRSITVDEKNNDIYGISYGQNGVYKFDYTGVN
jgi:hypothetical protein